MSEVLSSNITIFVEKNDNIVYRLWANKLKRIQKEIVAYKYIREIVLFLLQTYRTNA